MLMLMLYGFDIKSVMGDMFYVIIFMIVFDVVTGVLASAKMRKLNSSISFNGLIRKLGLIVGVAFLTVIDYYLHMEGEILKVGSGMVILTEVMSVIENFSVIGIKLDFLTKYFEDYKVGRK